MHEIGSVIVYGILFIKTHGDGRAISSDVQGLRQHPLHDLVTELHVWSALITINNGN